MSVEEKTIPSFVDYIKGGLVTVFFSYMQLLSIIYFYIIFTSDKGRDNATLRVNRKEVSTTPTPLLSVCMCVNDYNSVQISLKCFRWTAIGTRRTRVTFRIFYTEYHDPKIPSRIFRMQKGIFTAFYMRDALHSAVFAVVRCLSVTRRYSL